MWGQAETPLVTVAVPVQNQVLPHLLRGRPRLVLIDTAVQAVQWVHLGLKKKTVSGFIGQGNTWRTSCSLAALRYCSDKKEFKI